MPFFHELTLSGAARVAEYQGGAGTVWAYNAGVDWAPVRDIRFRGNYSRAVRAPNVSETGIPAGPELRARLPRSLRPDRNAAGNTPNRSANCAADRRVLPA